MARIVTTFRSLVIGYKRFVLEAVCVSAASASFLPCTLVAYIFEDNSVQLRFRGVNPLLNPVPKHGLIGFDDIPALVGRLNHSPPRLWIYLYAKSDHDWHCEKATR